MWSSDSTEQATIVISSIEVLGSQEQESPYMNCANGWLHPDQLPSISWGKGSDGGWLLGVRSQEAVLLLGLDSEPVLD